VDIAVGRRGESDGTGKIKRENKNDGTEL